MPSNNDQEMFAVKLVSEHKTKKKNYMIVRKLCIGDSVDFIDYPKSRNRELWKQNEKPSHMFL